MTGRAAPRAVGERGSATVLVLAAMAALMLSAGTGLALGAVATARHRAAAAADLAALAAARRTSVGSPPAGCAPARTVAAAQGGVVLACSVRADGSVEVLVGTPLPGWVGRRGGGGAALVQARARAGTSP